MGADEGLLYLACGSAHLLAWGSALAGVLSFASPKESSQRKGDPGLCARLRRVPCATRHWRVAAELGPTGLRQSSPFFRQRLRCSARHTGQLTATPSQISSGALKKNSFSRNSASTRMVLPAPLRGAEQRRKAGGLWLALFEPQASLASRPALRVAQGTGQRPAPTQGSPFLCLLSFGEAKESKTPSRRNPK